MVEILKSKLSEMTVSRDGLDVVLVKNGQRVCELPWDAALVLARAITIQARRIEEWVKAERVSLDQAFILRQGLPFGLTSNPMIIQEAYKEAAHNTELRKRIPHVDEGIRSREALGTPSLIKHRPKKEAGDGLQQKK